MESRSKLKISKIFVFFAVLAIIAAWILPNLKEPVWPQDNSDLKPDPKAKWGQLKNGLRYVVMPNNEPPERVNLRLHIHAGSLMEKEDQRGLAHFLEHMAFNGTKHFSQGEMVKYFQRIGMAFGADTNAHTSFKETVYTIDLPENSTEYLKDGLTILRDYADGMLLKSDAIDAERGIILSEKRDRDTAAYRIYEAFIHFLLSGTRVPERLPIGLEKVIEEADRGRFVDYYSTWYTPDRMTLVVTGDVFLDAIEPMINEYFGSIKTPELKQEDPDSGMIKPTPLKVAFHAEKEASVTEVNIVSVKNHEKTPDTFGRRVEDLYREAAYVMMNRRFDILSKAEDTSFTDAGSYSMEYLKAFNIDSVNVSCEPEQWEKALAVAEQELRRVLDHGFTQSEVDEVRAKFSNVLESAAKGASTRKTDEITAHVMQSISDDVVFTSPGDDYEMMKPILEKMTPEKCFLAFKDSWEGGSRSIFVAGNLVLEDAETKILAVYEESRKVPVTKPKEREYKAFAYNNFGTPGKITNDSFHKGLDVYQYRFANNVHLNLKKTNFEAEKVYVKIRFGAGNLEYLPDKPGLATLANRTFTLGGVDKHSHEELEAIFAGKSIKLDFKVGNDAFILVGETNADDLRDQLNLLTAYLVAHAYREEALSIAHRILEESYREWEQTPLGVFSDEVKRYLASGDPRFGFPPKEALFKLTLKDLRSWLEKPLKDGFLEVSIVGDFERESAVDAVAATLGALPKRMLDKPPYKKERQVDFPDGAVIQTFPIKSELPTSVTANFWPTNDIEEIVEARRLNLLGEIFTDRLRVNVREDKGEAYSYFAANLPSKTYKDYGYFIALVFVDPDKVESVGEEILSISKAIVDKGITEDEFNRAHEPLLREVELNERENSYWIQVLEASQEYPQRLDWAQTLVPSFENMKSEDINNVAHKFLDTSKMVRAHIVPDIRNATAE